MNFSLVAPDANFVLITANQLNLYGCAESRSSLLLSFMFYEPD